MIVKFGNRRNLIYPLLLVIFIALRRIETKIFSKKEYKFNGTFFSASLIFLAKFIAGCMTYSYSLQEMKTSPQKEIMGMVLNEKKGKFQSRDGWPKIAILIFFASYFDFIGTIVRKLYIKNSEIKEIDTIEQSVRSFQVVASAIFCKILLRIPFYRHQFFLLIIIGVCLFSIVLVDIICIENQWSNRIISFGLTFFSCIGRALLDTIEKYLFEINFMNPFILLIFEGLINFIMTISLFFFLKKPIIELNEIVDNIFIQHNFILVIIIIFYIILTFFKNIYRVVTIKLFSPMTRALAESLLDPIIIVYYTFDLGIKNKNYNFWVFFGVILICSIIMPFSSCVYNEFIILFCCGLEHETHIEITRRGDSDYLLKEKKGKISRIELEGGILLDIENDDNSSVKSNISNK